ncbi:MAG: mannose-1-phosphate guanylyltransferase, partial [Pseudomonadota bacterium]
MSITPILLCGGAGTRLWPLSRKSYPKQFADLLGDQTLFQASAQRLSAFDRPVVVTGSDFRFIVTEQLMAIGIDPGAILIEPEGRNTAPAVLAAALHLHQQNPDAMMLVCPSDHLIPDNDAFLAAVDQARLAADQDQLVTFGITPTYPETGYGYLELEAPATGGTAPLSRFVEKPDTDTAADLVASGRHLWNAGIFMFRASAIIAAFQTHAPALMDPVTAAVNNAEADLGFLRLAPEPWAGADDISIDYAVMEHAQNLSVVPYESAWSDLGGWDAVWRESEQDGRGVATHGAATAIDCDSTLLRSESEGLELVGIGL